ncbi:hypothetical protein JCM17960_20050 [Magnetospira thiophila]
MLDTRGNSERYLEAALRDRACALERRIFSLGDVIFEEGDEGGEAFLLLSGAVEITKTSQRTPRLRLNRINAGDIFGEMALIDGQPRMATATALTETECYILPRSLFFEELSKVDPFTRFLMNTLLVHVRNMGMRMTAQADLARVPFKARFVNAFVAHGRGIGDVSYFFCDGDGDKLDYAAELIHQDPVCRMWNGVAAKLGYVDDLNVLDAMELESLRCLVGPEELDERDRDYIDLIYQSDDLRDMLTARAEEICADHCGA